MICDECETVAHCLKNGCVPKQPSKDEVLKMALETFERVSEEFHIHQMTTAITAIKQALSDATPLADAALDRMAENARELGLMPLRGGDYEPVQQSRSDVEPVAWVVEDEHGERLEWAGDAHSCHGLATLPLYTTPPAAEFVCSTGLCHYKAQPAPVQEPVAQPASEEDMKVYRAIADNYRKDLAAAQRQWVEVEQIKWDGDKLIAKLKENT